MSREKREDTEILEEKTGKVLVDRVIRKEAVEAADLETILNKTDSASIEITAFLGEGFVSTDPVDLKPYLRKLYMSVSGIKLTSFAEAGILVLPRTREETDAVNEIAEKYNIPVISVATGTKIKNDVDPLRDGLIIMDLRLMGSKISKPCEMPPLINKYILLRWSENLRPVRQRFVEAGLVGATFTEKAPDLPFERLNYYFDHEGVLQFDFDSEEDTGETIMTYKDFETGYRALSDRNFDSMQAFLDGKFKLEPSAETALKMHSLMPNMVEAFIKAIKDVEKEFNIELPKYE